MLGRVKFWDDKKGFGFVTNGDGQDAFVHYSDIVMHGRKTLSQGQSVEYDVRATEKGPRAAQVRVPGEAA